MSYELWNSCVVHIFVLVCSALIADKYVPYIIKPKTINPLTLPTMKVLRRHYITTFVLLTTAVVIYVYCSYIENNFKAHPVFRVNVRSINPKYQKAILLWTIGLESLNVPQTCHFNNCFVTEDRTKLPVEMYDAILVHIPRKANDTREIIQAEEQSEVRVCEPGNSIAF